MASGLSSLSFEDQVLALEKTLKSLTQAQCVPKALGEFINYARDIPEQFIPASFITLISTKFSVDEKTIQQSLNGVFIPVQGEFDDLVPQSGWLHDYVEYTKQTEPPTAFHFFAGATVIGATIARRVYFPRGDKDVFPNLCVVLVAPPGKCKKTTACNLAVNLFRRIGGNVLADKITPEAIIESFQKQPTATGLIYAPEWSVFLGKQQYLEGLVPLLTALFDCPQYWSSTTIMRGTAQLQNVALSHLAATTIDWMQSAVSEEAFTGGFMSRLLFVVQKTTPRSFPLPPKGDKALEKKLIDGLLSLQHVVGEVSLSPEAENWYIKWYATRSQITADKHFAGYLERKPDRVLQLAMVLNSARDPKNLILDLETVRRAESILTWLEYHLPGAFEELTQSSIGEDQLRLLKQLRKNKGELQHSTWLRLNTSRMDSHRFRQYVETLRQAKMITYDHTRHTYFLLPAGKAVE